MTAPDQARQRSGMGAFEECAAPWIGGDFPEVRPTILPKHTRRE